MTIPIYLLALTSIPLGAIILALLIPGTKNLYRARGLYSQKDNKIIYLLGPMLAVTILIPLLLFSQYLEPGYSFSVFLACYLILLLATIKADLHKLYPLQWFILWLIISILLNDFGPSNILSIIHLSIVNYQLHYWLSLLLLYLLLLLLHFFSTKLPSGPVFRSWIFLPSLILLFGYLFINELYNGILLPGTIMGALLLSLWLNRPKATSFWNPGSTTIILTLFSLFWLTLIQPPEHQFRVLFLWLLPLLIILLVWQIIENRKLKTSKL